MIPKVVAAVPEKPKLPKAPAPTPKPSPVAALPKPSPKPTPISEPRAPVSVASRTPVKPRAWYGLSPLAQYGSFSQSTSTSLLREVALDSAYVAEGLRFEYENADQRALLVDLRANHFESESGGITKTRTMRLDIVALRHSRNFGGLLEWGALASLDDRFEKISAQSIGLKRGISLGAYVALDSARTHARRSAGTRLALGVPITGIVGSGIIGGPYGAKLALEHRWFLSNRGGWNPRFLVAEANGEYLLWGDPDGTQVTRWALRIGPKWVLE
jgi:hypothetical protein